jgi:hypothetical protein
VTQKKIYIGLGATEASEGLRWAREGGARGWWFTAHWRIEW